MNLDQLKKQNYIPNIIALIFSGMMFALMALPHSQYDLLSSMTLLNQGETLNLFITIPAILTIFVILLYCIVFLMSLLSLFMERFYNYHFISIVNSFVILCCVLTQSGYFIVNIIGYFQKKADILSFGNVITIILNVLFLVSYIYTYKRFISQPFKELMEKAKEMKEDCKEETKKEVPIKTEVKNDSEKQVLDMLSDGKITSEEAMKLLHEIHHDKP